MPVPFVFRRAGARVVGALALALGAPVVPAAAQRPLSLPQALALARAAAPTIAEARGVERSAAAARRAAVSRFIPSVNLTANAAEQNPVTPRVNPATGELISGRWAMSEGVAINLDLFSGFNRLADLRGARAAIDAAEAGTEAQDVALALQVKQQFFASLQAREAERAAEEQLRLAEAQLAASRLRVIARTVTRSDSLRATLAVAQARLAIGTARNDRLVADAALARLTGQAAAVTADSAGLADPRTLALDSAALVALAGRTPAVRAAESRVAEAEQNVRGARSGYWPTLALSWVRNRVATAPRFDPFPPQFNHAGQLRFAINVPVWNQYVREQQLVQAQVVAATADATARDARLAARQQVLQGFGAWRTALLQLDVQAASVVAAEEDLRVQEQRYALGASTQLDVQVSQNALAAARLALVQARFAARLARAQLEAAVGRDL
mgnify:FL=1